jgi:hypothetical protein
VLETDLYIAPLLAVSENLPSLGTSPDLILPLNTPAPVVIVSFALVESRYFGPRVAYLRRLGCRLRNPTQTSSMWGSVRIPPSW